ncbi:unnamed protein product, partial [Linum tenue]
PSTFFYSPPRQQGSSSSPPLHSFSSTANGISFLSTTNKNPVLSILLPLDEHKEGSSSIPVIIKL